MSTVRTRNSANSHGPGTSGSGPGARPRRRGQNGGQNQRRQNGAGGANDAGPNLPKPPNGSRPPAQREPTSGSGSSRSKKPGVASGDRLRYPKDVVAATGPLFADAKALGFNRPPSTVARKVPRWLATQPRMLVTPPIDVDAWDSANQEKMAELEAAGGDYQGIYEEMQRMRETERKEMEKRGLVDAENTSKNLTDAISFHGSCLDMCPVFERVRRALENNVKRLEKDPATGRISRELAVKAFSRPAAGQPPPLPSEVRPPQVLKQTLDYLVSNIVQQLPEAHSFIWDRTRSIRQDFTYQNAFGPEAIDCNERIVRIHLVSLHVMAGSDVEHSQQQELEQLHKALQTLVEIYDDVRNHGGQCPNEPEFRAYQLLAHLRDPEVEREVQTLPSDVYKHPHVQHALRLRAMASQNDLKQRGYANVPGANERYVEFFRQVFSQATPFLFGCLLEVHFNEIRFYALKSMSRSYHTKMAGGGLPVDAIRDMLGFDTSDNVVSFVEYFDLPVVASPDGKDVVDLFSKTSMASLSSLEEKPRRAQAYSPQLDSKLGQGLVTIVNSGLPNDDLKMTVAPKVVKVKTKKPRASAASKYGADAQMNGDARKPSDKPATNTPFGQAPSSFGQPPASTFGQVPNSTFGQKPAPAFGQKPPSTFGQPPTTQAFGQAPSGGTFGQAPSSQTPAFSFGQNKPSGDTAKTSGEPFPNQKGPSLPTKPSFGVDENKSAPAPQFNPTPAVPQFGAVKSQSGENTTPSPQSGSTAPLVIPRVRKSVSTLPTPAALFGTDSASSSAPLFSKPAESSATGLFASKPASEDKPKTEEAPTLKSNPRFEEAVSSVANELVSAQVVSEVTARVNEALAQQQRAQLRDSLVGTLTNELYEAFVAELSYMTTQSAVAAVTYDRNVKKRVARYFHKGAAAIAASKRERMEQQQELESVSFAQKRRRVKPASETRQQPQFHHGDGEAMHALWAPLSLSAFADLSHQPLTFLVAVEDWAQPQSKWLNTKLDLKVSDEGFNYSRQVGATRVVSLPASSHVNKSFFDNTPFVLFECGSMATVPTPEMLASQARALGKIVQLLARFDKLKVQIVVTYWDSSDKPRSTAEVETALGVATLRATPQVQSVDVCNMGTADDINETLDGLMKKLASGYDGGLTERGRRHLDRHANKRRRVSEAGSMAAPPAVTRQPSKPTTDPAAAIRAKEQQLLAKANRLKRYSYLNRYLRDPSPSGITSRTSSAASSRRNSFLTHSFAGSGRSTPNGSMMSNTSSVFSDSTTMGTAANMSAFAGYGSGVTAQRDQKLAELQEIMAKAKAKYL
ncbi:nuclear mRNA export protein Sac3p [Diutina catenulata]